MLTITFECETITPMFLAGADAKTPELRAPSIKGAMRFWWRAMHGYLPIDKLREKEAEIFGGSGNDEGRSKVVIKVDKSLEYNGKYEYKPIPHRNFKLPAFPPNQEFSITCFFNKTVFYKGKIIFDFNIMKNLFILLSILGGLGKRVRRGFGSFRITKINNDVFSFDYSLSSICDLLNSISSNFDIQNNKIVQINNPHQNADYPYIKEIEIGKDYNDIHSLLYKISEESSENDCYYTGFAEKVWNPQKKKKESKRFSSPIFISVILNNKYMPIITTLNCAFEKNVKNILKNVKKWENNSMSFKKAILK